MVVHQAYRFARSSPRAERALCSRGEARRVICGNGLAPLQGAFLLSTRSRRSTSGYLRAASADAGWRLFKTHFHAVREREEKRPCVEDAPRRRIPRRVGLKNRMNDVCGSGLALSDGVIVGESLNVVGMLRNRGLARAVADAALGEIRRQLAYKTAVYGSRLVCADRFYPSSKRCSRCGAVEERLPLWERWFRCDVCGLVLERDENSARTLRAPHAIRRSCGDPVGTAPSG